MQRSLSLALLLFNCWNVSAQNTTRFADSIRANYNIPELSYAVIDSKTILEIAACGKHAVNLTDTATLNDRFHIGSNTKAMTAFVIAKYTEKGKLSWSTKFFDIYPEWKEKSNAAYANITLQDLLSHKAGIPPFQGNAGFATGEEIKLPDFKGSKQEKRKQFAQFVLKQDAVQPDEQNPFIYSNAGYVLATLMVEKVTGKSWEQLIKKVFNKDLQLNVKFSWPENKKHKDTWGHSFENGKLIPVASNTQNRIELDEPAGDLNITLRDYIKFIQLNLQGLEGKNNYLYVSTYKFIHTGIKNYSLGWYNIYEHGKELSTHGGTAGTYYTQVHIDRIKKRAYIIFTNAYSDNTVQGVRLLMRKLKEIYGS